MEVIVVKMIKQILILLIFLMTINIAIASEPVAYYHVDNTFNLNIPCYNAGAYCSGSAICNITIIDPQVDTFIDNKQMTNDGAYHNITINPTIIGDYQVYVMCTDGSNSNYNSFIFQVNNVGREIQNLQPMLFFYILLIVIIILFLSLAIKYDSPMVLPLLFMLVLLFSWIFFFIYMHTISLTRIYYVFYWFFNIISVGIFFVILWHGTMMAIEKFSHGGKRQKDLGDDF